jgi:hypothetical protein
MASSLTPRSTPFGRWITDYKRYYEYAGLCLSELLPIAAEIDKLLPSQPPRTLAPELVTPEIQAKCRRRDALSDSVRVFSAMSVEAYLNLYGVMRFGEAQYKAFERKASTPKKLALILKTCDGVDVNSYPALRDAVEFLKTQRDSLVHPKANELPSSAQYSLTGPDVPGFAQRCYSACETVFNEMPKASPQAMDLIP